MGSRAGRSSGTYVTFWSSGRMTDVYQMEISWIPLPGTSSSANTVTREQFAQSPRRIIIAFNVPSGNNARTDWITTQSDAATHPDSTSGKWIQIGTANASILTNMIAQVGTHQLLVEVDGSKIRMYNMTSGQEMVTIETSLSTVGLTEGLHIVSVLMFNSDLSANALPAQDVMVSFLSLPPNNPLCRQCPDCREAVRKATQPWSTAMAIVILVSLVLLFMVRRSARKRGFAEGKGVVHCITVPGGCIKQPVS